MEIDGELYSPEKEPNFNKFIYSEVNY